MNWIKATLAELRPAAVLRPSEYFAAPGIWWSGLVAIALLGLLFAFLQSIGTLINLGALQGAHMEWSRMAAATASPGLEALHRPSALRPLLFPFYWLLYAGLVSLIRRAMAFLQATSVHFLPLLRISAWASIPFLIVGGVLGLMNLLLPYSPFNYQILRVWFSVVLVLCAWIAEGIVFVRAFRASAGASPGPALFIWASPALLGLVSAGAFFFVMLAS